MKLATRWAMLLSLVFAAPGLAQAADYCPEGYYGYINGSYMYYCDYCDANGACDHAGIAVSTMHTCGGDVACCTAGASCIDPITEPSFSPAGIESGEPAAESSAAESKPAAPAAKPGDESKNPAPAKAAPAVTGPPRIAMLIGEMPQKKYLTASERFIVPGDQVTIHHEAIVQVREPDNTKSYFRLFKMTYAGKDAEHQGTVCFGMEMDPEKPPMNSASAVRAKKGQGAVYKHTVRFNNENYDVSSVRVLPDAT